VPRSSRGSTRFDGRVHADLGRSVSRTVSGVIVIPDAQREGASRGGAETDHLMRDLGNFPHRRALPRSE
jgi:hypothetical protein